MSASTAVVMNGEEKPVGEGLFVAAGKHASLRERGAKAAKSSCRGAQTLRIGDTISALSDFHFISLRLQPT
jgi:hypothetical protein